MTALGTRPHRDRTAKTCASCGLEFPRLAKNSGPEWRRRRYCTVACSVRGLRDKQPPRPGIQESCAWMDRAACRGSLAEFVPDSKADAQQALRECQESSCPVRAQCLRFASDTGAHGVWGGHYLTYGVVTS
jgi:hypothetical protein